MLLLNLVKRSNQKVAAEIVDSDGGIIHQRLVNRYSDKDVRWLVELNPEWNVADVNRELNELCDEIQESVDEPVQRAFEFEPRPGLIESITAVATVEPGSTVGSTGKVEPGSTDTPAPPEPFVIHVRELNQLKKFGVSFQDLEPHEALRKAFNGTAPGSVEPILEWYDTDRLCCLDIDYHGMVLNSRPNAGQLADAVSKLKPQPYCWHPSHGQGAKLYYSSRPGFTAKELAAVAGLRWVEIDPRATFDLIKSTRHPAFKRSRDNAPAPSSNGDAVPGSTSTDAGIHYVYGSSDVSYIRRLLNSDLDYADIEEYLSSRGWVMGQTLPHTECPIDPSDDYKENVYIGDRGIYCHKCASKGYGGYTPGLTSYASLIGGTDNRLRNMVKNFCHLEHAKIILSNLYPNIPIKILETIYKVLLKIVHTTDDPRIDMAMCAGRGFIRTAGQWVSADGQHVISKNLDVFIKSLPATLYPKDDGFGLNIPTATSFLNSCNLDEYGYQDVSFIRGAKIYGQFLPYSDNEIVKVITRPEFKKHTPTYVPLNKRMPSEDAWGLIESEFPGIDYNYVKLLIAAKGSSEGRTSQCPFLLITGPSGSGKSTTVQIAAGICGDKSEEPIWVPHVDRFRQSLMDAARNSGFICINEVFKMAERSKLSCTQALDPMLSLTEDSRSHVMYVGTVPFGRLPVFVLTDINIPIEVEQDIQLSRRFTFYRLKQRNYWSDTFVHKRIRPHEFRLISPDHNGAADSILSEIIDTYFRSTISLTEIAEALDIQTLEQYTETVDDKAGLLLRFYNAVINAPPLIGSDATKYDSSKGWKRIDRINQSPINELWLDICDGQQPEQWCKSRVAESEDWSKLAKVKMPIQLDIRPYRGNVVFVRFRSCESGRIPAWINGKLT